MTGVPRHIAEHRLNIREGCLPIRQKKRGQAPERNKAIQEEVEKLVDAGIMKEVHYHSWLSNPVMVKKHDGSWRMCVDFKDLNKACPKDGYPLPEIDWKVESLCGYPFKCFLDAYKGYHQIKMAKEDEEKTAFITSQGIFCYSKMSFGLKNAGATYQRLVDRAFQKQIGRNLEVYVDDLEGMFLGYKVNTDELKVCPEKADAVLSFPSPRCLKDVEKLNGKLARIRSSLQTDKKTHHGAPNADRTKGKGGANHVLSRGQGSYQCSLNDRKERQANASVLCEPRPTRAEDQLHPHGKTGISLAQRKQRLKRYFQAHTIVVITDQLIKQLLSNSEITGRILKWKFELEGYDIEYRPRISIKGQILADFILEQPEEESPNELMAEPEALGTLDFVHRWVILFEATNNEAGYEALIAGLRIAEQMGVKNLQANVDSRLVANQVNGSYVAKESCMVQYLEKNKKADALSKVASTSFTHLSKQVLVEELKEKSINEKEVLAIVEEEGHTWMTPICEYLTKEILLEDKKKARAVPRKASRYAVINGTLYKKSFLGPWLRCVGLLQANYDLREIHEGSYSMHFDPRSVVVKAIRIGYYWPMMHTDARKLIKECNDYQIHHPILRNPQQNLTPIMSLWPFYKCGIDIAGPFLEGLGKVKFLIVAIDYFTKWIEAKPVATITGNQVKKFVWDNIVCRFGLPGEIVSDNGKQFCDNPFKDLCEKLCIRQCFTSVKHPQTNGLIERANISLREGIKARLDERSKDWIGELSHVLWAHRTMIKSSNGETSFSLTCGTEAVIPAKIGMPTLRTAEVDLTKNDEALEINLDLIEEKREQAAIQKAKSNAKMKKYYNSKVRGR
ncbi:reverse transcriptase domain-containing protein [Tanacetum coccineum]